MAEPILSSTEFEEMISSVFRTEEFDEADFDNVQRLLTLRGKKDWAIRPRTYVVLRMIDRVDLLQDFVVEGLKDIAFPYSPSQLPPALNSQSLRSRFLGKQHLVLTKATDLEAGDGAHRHFAHDVDSHFINLGLLGRGGFGEVHHLQSKLSLEQYARKRIHRKRAFLKNKTDLALFENELTHLKKLSHPHLVQFKGSYTDPKYIGLLMSPVAECDMRVFLERRPLSASQCLLLRGFFGCLASAMMYLHEEKIRHKDIKPQNILIKEQTVLITDFGCARDWSSQTKSTTTGLPDAFTREYAAPEVIFYESRGTSADIWSLGCVFLDMTEALNGIRPEDRLNFLKRNGTKEEFPSSNIKGILLWLERPPEGGSDSEPLKWIRKMLCQDRNSRILANVLFEDIQNFKGRHIYFGHCCADEDLSESGTSYEPSVFERRPYVTEISDAPDEPQDRDAKVDDGSEQQPKGDNPSPILKPISTEESLSESVEEKSTVTGAEDAPQHSISMHGIKVDFAEKTVNKPLVESRPIVISHTDYSREVFDLYRHNVYEIDGSLNDHMEDTFPEPPVSANERANMMLVLKDSGTLSRGVFITEVSLFWAIEEGYVKLVNFILNHVRIVPSPKDERGRTPLWVAAYHGFCNIVKILLQVGSQSVVYMEDDEKRSPLHVACQNGHTSVIRQLIEAGASINGYRYYLEERQKLEPEARAERLRNHWTANLHINEKEHFIMSNTTRSHPRPVDFLTPLQLAILGHHEGAVSLLLKCNADVIAGTLHHESALSLAIEEGCDGLASMMVKHLVDQNIVPSPEFLNENLLQATEQGLLSTTHALLNLGAVVRHVPDDDHLHLARNAIYNIIRHDMRDVLKKSLRTNESLHLNKSLLNSICGYGLLPVHAVISFGKQRYGMIEILAANGANVEAKNKENHTPLRAGIEANDLDLIKTLIKCGVETGGRYGQGLTPLHCAAYKSDPSIIQYLLGIKADPNVRDIVGETPLHFAVKRSSTEIVSLLLNHGANCHLADHGGLTPLDVVVEFRLHLILKVMQRALPQDTAIQIAAKTSQILMHELSEHQLTDTWTLKLEPQSREYVDRSFVPGNKVYEASNFVLHHLVVPKLLSSGFNDINVAEHERTAFSVVMSHLASRGAEIANTQKITQSGALNSFDINKGPSHEIERQMSSHTVSIKFCDGTIDVEELFHYVSGTDFTTCLRRRSYTEVILRSWPVVSIGDQRILAEKRANLEILWCCLTVALDILIRCDKELIQKLEQDISMPEGQRLLRTQKVLNDIVLQYQISWRVFEPPFLTSSSGWLAGKGHFLRLQKETSLEQFERLYFENFELTAFEAQDYFQKMGFLDFWKSEQGTLRLTDKSDSKFFTWCTTSQLHRYILGRYRSTVDGSSSWTIFKQRHNVYATSVRMLSALEIRRYNITSFMFQTIGDPIPVPKQEGETAAQWLRRIAHNSEEQATLRHYLDYAKSFSLDILERRSFALDGLRWYRYCQSGFKVPWFPIFDVDHSQMKADQPLPPLRSTSSIFLPLQVT